MYVNAGVVTEDGTVDTIVIGGDTYMGPKYSYDEIATSVENNSVTAGQNFELGTGLKVSYIGQQKDYGNRTFVGDKLVANYIATTASGGAVYGSYVSLKLSDSTFTGNTAANGGAVYNTTAGINGTDGKFSLTGCIFTANRATSHGGAVYVLYDEQTITGSTFSGNTAGKNGGAVYLNGGSTSITGSTFTGNAASSTGGAIYTSGTNTAAISDSTFDGNTATKEGGAVYLKGGSTSITGSTFTGNAAANGGAVYGNGGTLTIRDSVFATVSDTIENSGGTLTLGGTITTAAQIVSDNAINFETGALLALDISGYTAGNTTSLLGNYDTAFANNANFSITVNVASAQNNGDYLLAGNAAAFDKAITVKCGGNTIGTFASAGSSFIYNDRTYQLALNSTNLLLTIKDKSTFDRTVVESGQTKTLSAGTYTNPEIYSGNGAVAEVQEGGTLIVKDSAVFTGNTAANGGAVFNAGTASVTGSTFTGNAAGTYGGAIRNEGMATINASIFSKNMAGNSGAVANFGTASISGSTFTSNTAGQFGGAVFNGNNGTGNNETIEISGSTFTGNAAEKTGGAFYSDGTATITDSVFTGNTAKLGGAVANNKGPATITGSTFTGNMAGQFGGAINNNGGALTIRNSVFATESDTIYNRGENLTLGGTITTAAQIYSDKAITVEADTDLVLDLTSYTEGNTISILGNYDTAFVKAEDNFTLSVRVTAVQATGNYILADSASQFGETVTVVCNGGTIGTIGIGETVRNYALTLDGSNNVVLSVGETPVANLVLGDNGEVRYRTGDKLTTVTGVLWGTGDWEVIDQGKFSASGLTDTLMSYDNGTVTSVAALKNSGSYSNPVLADGAHTDIRGFQNSDWEFFGVADVNGDGIDDVITVETASHAGSNDRNVNAWIMGGQGAYQSDKRLGGMNSEWNLMGFAEMDGDVANGKEAILQNSVSGLVGYWKQGEGGESLKDISCADDWWSFAGAGDFDGDGIGDILWQGQDGKFAAWTKFNYSDRGYVTHTDLGALDGDYAFSRVMDVDMDGTDEVLWKATASDAMGWNKADSEDNFRRFTLLA